MVDCLKDLNEPASAADVALQRITLFLSDAAAASQEKRYPLQSYVCRRCGLVQILEAIDHKILFQEYAFASSTVGPLVDHFGNYAKWLKEKFDPALVVEFGCNDGILLQPLQKLGVQ